MKNFYAFASIFLISVTLTIASCKKSTGDSDEGTRQYGTVEGASGNSDPATSPGSNIDQESDAARMTDGDTTAVVSSASTHDPTEETKTDDKK